MTDEELDAATEGLQFMLDLYRDKQSWEGYPRKLRDGIAAITTLRAQLAEARAELVRRVDMHECAMAERDDATLHSDEQRARADRAEAALAAQIEVDAGMIERIVTEARQEVGSIKLSKVDAAVVEILSGIAKAIRNQPHDRTALDNYREKVLREARRMGLKHQ